MKLTIPTAGGTTYAGYAPNEAIAAGVPLSAIKEAVKAEIQRTKLRLLEPSNGYVTASLEGEPIPQIVQENRASIKAWAANAEAAIDAAATAEELEIAAPSEH